jgi:hypothetical protein
MATFSVDISAAEKKALLWDLGNVENAQLWLENAIHNKARRCIDDMVFQETSERPDKLTPAEKETIVNGLP